MAPNEQSKSSLILPMREGVKQLPVGRVAGPACGSEFPDVAEDCFHRLSRHEQDLFSGW
jgi:hypothetical protein